jgi:hypothetical protein
MTAKRENEKTITEGESMKVNEYPKNKSNQVNESNLMCMILQERRATMAVDKD